MGAELVVVLIVLVVVIGLAALAGTRAKASALERQRAELEPVAKLAFEDVTALGEELQRLDADLVGRDLDAGAQADYQRALDDYEAAKTAGDAMTSPDDITHVTEILDGGRYAIACVRARMAGEPLPTRRPPCFFDPRHGTAVDDVDYTPPGGVERRVPACALDAERVRAGAEPDTRKVLVGAQRVPYWQGGRAYEPYAAGYYSAVGTNMLFAGLMFGSLGGFGGGDYGGDSGGGGGDGGGDFGGGDGGGFDFGGF